MPLIAIDGEIRDVAPERRVGADALEDLVDREDIYWIQVVCMDPRDSTFQRDHGLPVISVWTKDGPAGRMEPTLVRIRDAQDRYFQRHGAYGGDLDAIEVSELPDRVEIELDATGGWWAAIARTARFLGRCRANPHIEPYCEDDR